MKVLGQDRTCRFRYAALGRRWNGRLFQFDSSVEAGFGDPLFCRRKGIFLSFLEEKLRSIIVPGH